ncbi:carboxypeptidase regulatory-like domain-containing protein [Nocardioides alcanivorans]|uniref:carboxypeptidase regulatory-like domain-containing protein n=1 Tax=Nocardioides alcanivorans TaxID=2897352 RepID=UPI001F309C3D|nr:carboxypeptidase regulatory-like domain-containing protein [Nocardioides alcanivorans]
MLVAPKRLLTVVLTALALLLSGLVLAPAQAAETGVITGLVKAKVGGTTSVHPDANLYLAKYRADDDFFTDPVGSTSSDASGRFSFDGLSDGFYELRAYPQGPLGPGELGYEYYDNKWSPYGSTRIEVSGGTVTLNDIVFEETGWITGSVTDEAGQPIPDSTISIGDSENSGGAGGTVGADGSFDSRDYDHTGNLIPGSYVVSANAYGDDIEGPVYAGAEVPVTVTANQGITAPAIELKQLQTAVITVLDTDGSPLVEAPIRIWVQTDPGAPFMPIQSGPHETDADGKYRFVEGWANYKFQVLTPTEYDGTGVAEYWDGPSGDGAYAFADAATLDWPASGPMKRNFTVQLGAAPTIKPSTPTIEGTVGVGRTVVAQHGAWSPSDVSLTYEWLKNGVPIPGATERELTITEAIADELTLLQVRVIGTKSGLPSVDILSDYWSGTPAPGDPPVTFTRPTITGTAQVGLPLTAVAGDWGPVGVELTHQWAADGALIEGADEPTFTPTGAQQGKAISVAVTGTLAGYSTVSRTSAPTAPVAAAPVVEIVPGTPMITGKAQSGSTLTVDTGAWGPDGVKLTQQWLAGGTPIAGATGTTLKVSNAMAGKRISIKVTGKLAGTDDVSVTSTATSAVVGVLTSTKPKIKGKAKVGKKLKAKTGSWGPKPVTLKYQWLRNGKKIKGATKANYKLVKKDAKKKISVKVAGKRANFTTVSRTSAKTGKVKR